MFGDFFGTGSSLAAIPMARPGILNGVPGTAVFEGALATPTNMPNEFNYSHPGVSNLVTISMPTAAVNFTGPNGAAFDFDVVGVPPLNFMVDPATLATINNVTNAPPVVAQYVPIIEAAETTADPSVSLLGTQVQVDPNARIDLSELGGFDLVFPFALSTQVGTQMAIHIPSPAAGGSVVGRQKIAENNSPLPEDRLFLNYSHFDNVPMFPGGVNVDRVVPGFESTFYGGLMSLEARFPFAGTLDHDILADGLTNTSEAVFGNVTFNIKALLHKTEELAIAVGLGIALPTGEDITVGLRDGTELVRINNESVHLMPFLGFLRQSRGKQAFVHGFLQADFDTRGNAVSINSNGQTPTPAGRINDVTFLYADLGVGGWLYQAADPSQATITGIAPTLEMHYTGSWQSTDIVALGPFQVGHFADKFDLLNIVIGMTIVLGGEHHVGLAYATPVGGGLDQQFDGEFRATFNWYPGRSYGR